MKRADSLLDALAQLVEYPDAEFFTSLRHARAIARETDPQAASLVDRFADEIAFLPLGQLQEAYVEAFDLDPECALDLGWHLHGERRERGEMLAALRARLQAAGVSESSQLPDHLTHVLMLMARQPDEDRTGLASACAGPLEHIRDTLRRRGSPYALLIDAVHSAVGACGTVPKS
jgi:nitrate reductase delta subunit